MVLGVHGGWRERKRSVAKGRRVEAHQIQSRRRWLDPGPQEAFLALQVDHCIFPDSSFFDDLNIFGSPSVGERRKPCENVSFHLLPPSLSFVLQTAIVEEFSPSLSLPPSLHSSFHISAPLEMISEALPKPLQRASPTRRLDLPSLAASASSLRLQLLSRVLLCTSETLGLIPSPLSEKSTSLFQGTDLNGCLKT